MWNWRAVWKKQMGYVETITKKTFHMVSKTPELKKDHVWSKTATPSQRTATWERHENESTHPHYRNSKFIGMTTNMRNKFKVTLIDFLLTETTKTCRNPLWRTSHLCNSKKQFFMNTMACNKTADKLAKKGTTLHTKEIPSQADTLKKLLNCKIAKKYKQEANELAATKKCRDIHKIWAEYKGEARMEAVANFRLKTGHDCLGAHLRKTGIYESSECTICQMPNSTTDKEHLLRCSKLDTDQQALKNKMKL